MSVKVKYFSLAGITVLFIIFLAASGYSKVIYLSDYLRSYAIRTFNLYEKPEGGVTLISGDRYKKYIKTYQKKSDGLFHFGNFLFYKAPRNIKTSDLALNLIEYTDYYKLYELREALTSGNKITGGIVNAGEVVVIDEPLPSYIIDNLSAKAGEIKQVRGLYFSGDFAGGRAFLSKLPYFRSIGINAVVFDVKDITGIVHVKNSRVKDVRDFSLNRDGAVDNLPKLIRECRKNGIYLIARISVFRDHLLYQLDPSSRIKSKTTGGDWNPGTKELWCDPANKKVQEYNIALAAELAAAGVDEIQFDYIRFPTLGEQDDAVYAGSSGKIDRVNVITDFLKRAHEAVAANGSFLSIDIFGVTAWGKDVDVKKLGQQIDLLAENCDVISPMLYPSHFSDNFDGYAKPGDHPYYFIFNGCRKVMDLAGKKAVVRPWLQAFGWRVSRYNAEYIAEQVRASDESCANGYLFWNASNKYDEVYRAMEMMKR